VHADHANEGGGLALTGALLRRFRDSIAGELNASRPASERVVVDAGIGGGTAATVRRRTQESLRETHCTA
jgi:hypothetical protein